MPCLSAVQDGSRSRTANMNVKQEIEWAAISAIQCPSCKAEVGKPCHYIGHGGGLCRTRKVKTHQRRLSKFMAEKVSWK